MVRFDNIRRKTGQCQIVRNDEEEQVKFVYELHSWCFKAHKVNDKRCGRDSKKPLNNDREATGKTGNIAAHHDLSLLVYASLMHVTVARTRALFDACTVQSFEFRSEKVKSYLQHLPALPYRVPWFG